MDVAQDIVITEPDCKTVDGIELVALVEGGEIIEGLGDRILGRTALEEVRDPYSAEVLCKANEQIDEEKMINIEEAGIEKITIRSALTCRTRIGVCSLCYGRDLARGHRRTSAKRW